MMSAAPLPRILCVDDEPNVLQSLGRTLRRRFDVTTSVGARAALAELEHGPGFAVVVSDLRMPEIDGVGLLSEVRRRAPDTVRILLTGYAELDAAIAAVNDGAVFRFLTKPCAPDTLLAALSAAADQHRLITAEKVLLEQTLHGSIKALTDVLALVNPAGFGRAVRVKQLIGVLAERLGLANRWELEVAAMFSQIGAITLPASIAEKIYNGEPLDHAESLAAARLPRVASDLLAGIPRLDEVRQILIQQDQRWDLAGGSRGGGEPGQPPIGARLLKLALDFDVLETRGLAPPVIVAALRDRTGAYDPAVLQALMDHLGEGLEEQVLDVDLRALRPGMVFAEDVRSATGILLIARGQEVTERLVERMRNLGHLTAAQQSVRMILPRTGHDRSAAPVP